MFGSSHGQTRIIREAYFEHPLYVPLVRRAYENWAELEREGGQLLFQQTGGLMIGPPDGQLVTGAQRLLITAGAWMSRLIAELALPLTVERQVLLWFDPMFHPEHFDSQRCPIYIAEHQSKRIIYGFPNLGEGVKVGRHHEGESTDPDRVRREVGLEDIEAMRVILRRFMPAIDTTPRSTAVCLYTNTPDSHFLIDFYPQHSQVLLASICSGHGFKFSSVFGEILADLLIEGSSAFDLSVFRLVRFKRLS